MYIDEDDMDDSVDTTRATTIPSNTTSDGEVVSSTCALCREGGNLTTRPLGTHTDEKKEIKFRFNF